MAHLLSVKSFTAGLSLPFYLFFSPQSFPLWKENFTFLFPSSKAHCDNSSVMLSGLLVAFFLLLEEVFKHSRSTPIIYLLVHLQAPRFSQSSRALSFWQALIISPHIFQQIQIIGGQLSPWLYLFVILQESIKASMLPGNTPLSSTVKAKHSCTRIFDILAINSTSSLSHLLQGVLWHGRSYQSYLCSEAPYVYILFMHFNFLKCYF